MSNRARRAHTHALRQRLMPPDPNLITIRLRISGARAAAQLRAVERALHRG